MTGRTETKKLPFATLDAAQSVAHMAQRQLQAGAVRTESSCVRAPGSSPRGLATFARIGAGAAASFLAAASVCAASAVAPHAAQAGLTLEQLAAQLVAGELPAARMLELEAPGLAPVPDFDINAMHVSADFLERARGDEGLRLEAYQDRGPGQGVWTIGYGHTGLMPDGTEVGEGVRITKAQAEAILIQDVAVMERAVRRLVDVPITQPQFDALVDFAFNKGPGRLSRSSLLEALNASDYIGTAKEFLRWKGDMKGLHVRAQSEHDIFMSGMPTGVIEALSSLKDVRTRAQKVVAHSSSELNGNLRRAVRAKSALDLPVLEQALAQSTEIVQALRGQVSTGKHVLAQLRQQQSALAAKFLGPSVQSDAKVAHALAAEVQVVGAAIERVQSDMQKQTQALSQHQSTHELLVWSCEVAQDLTAGDAVDPQGILELAQGWREQHEKAPKGRQLAPGITIDAKNFAQVARAFDDYARQAMEQQEQEQSPGLPIVRAAMR